MKKEHSIWMWRKPAPPTPVEVAKAELYDAHLDLLREQAKLEAAMSWVQTLENRVKRLEAYIGETK